ncbi:hypothetical protein ACNPON_17775 [Glutamicibacter sp. AGC13]
MTSNQVDEEYGFEVDEENGAAAEEVAYQDQEETFDHSDDLLGKFLDAASEVTDNIVSYPVTNRPGDWSLEFNALVTEAEVKAYDKFARGNRSARRAGAKGGEFSNAKMSARLLAEKNTAIYKGTGKDRKQVFDQDGEPLLLNSDELLEATGHPDDVQASIRAFLGDAGTSTMGGAVLREAGWAEDLTPLDPTDR